MALKTAENSYVPQQPVDTAVLRQAGCCFWPYPQSTSYPHTVQPPKEKARNRPRGLCFMRKVTVAATDHPHLAQPLVS